MHLKELRWISVEGEVDVHDEQVLFPFVDLPFPLLIIGFFNMVRQAHSVVK